MASDYINLLKKFFRLDHPTFALRSRSISAAKQQYEFVILWELAMVGLLEVKSMGLQCVLGNLSAACIISASHFTTLTQR